MLQVLPQILATMADGAVQLAGVPITPFAGLVNAIFSPFLVLFQTFFFVGLYAWLKAQAGETKVVKKAVAKKVVKIKKK